LIIDIDQYLDRGAKNGLHITAHTKYYDKSYGLSYLKSDYLCIYLNQYNSFKMS